MVQDFLKQQHKQIELVKAISQEDVSGIQRRVSERLRNLSTVRSQALQSGLTRTFENIYISSS